jgi:hypothetical protein
LGKLEVSGLALHGQRDGLAGEFSGNTHLGFSWAGEDADSASDRSEEWALTYEQCVLTPGVSPRARYTLRPSAPPITQTPKSI